MLIKEKKGIYSPITPGSIHQLISTNCVKSGVLGGNKLTKLNNVVQESCRNAI